MILASWVLAFAAQEDVGRLLERLEDESIEVREAAFRDLVARGPGALDEIRRREASAQGETRTRLGNAVREIERRARAAAMQGPPSRVTLKADRIPLREAVEAIRRQAPFPIVLEEGVPDQPVTLELRDVTAFEALDRLCRSHGGVLSRLPWHVKDPKGDRHPVTILAGVDAETRRHVDGAVLVDLREVRRLDRSDFGGKTDRDLEIVIQAAWEPALKPTAVRCSIQIVEDATGRAFAVRSGGSSDGQWDTALNLHYHFHLATLPPAGIESFRRISGLLELRFPSDVFTARVEKPVGKRDVKVEGGEASFTLKSCALAQSLYRVELETELGRRILGSGARSRFEMIDSRGRTWGHRRGSSGPTPTTLVLFFDAPDGAEVAELRALLLKDDPARPIVRRVPWTFENVPVR